jgi:hypothetical protein
MAISPARTLRVAGLAVVAGACAGAALPADAAFELQIDLNSLTAFYTPGGTTGGSFGTSATGVITLTDDANAYVAGLEVDGVSQPLTESLSTFAGSIELVGGVVVGGSFDVILSDGSRYSTFITEGSGKVVSQAGQGFAIDGLTFAGTFLNLVGGTDFGGVDVSDLGLRLLPGTFLAFAFNPDVEGFDDDTDLDLWVRQIPSPAGAALFGVAGLFAAGRRRRA